jgi:hypothetical protein
VALYTRTRWLRWEMKGNASAVPASSCSRSVQQTAAHLHLGTPSQLTDARDTQILDPPTLKRSAMLKRTPSRLLGAVGGKPSALARLKAAGVAGAGGLGGLPALPESDDGRWVARLATLNRGPWVLDPGSFLVIGQCSSACARRRTCPGASISPEVLARMPRQVTSRIVVP